MPRIAVYVKKLATTEFCFSGAMKSERMSGSLAIVVLDMEIVKIEIRRNREDLMKIQAMG